MKQADDLREDDRAVPSPTSRGFAYGVLTLKDLGFFKTIISIVFLHAGNAPFHGGPSRR